MTSLHHLTEKEIGLRLAHARFDPALAVERFPPEFFLEPPRPAAVLIPLLQAEAEWHVLFTRRTASLPEHSGQVAFPGGRADLDDPSPVATALREAYEEIGLQPQDVRILGQLPVLPTISNYAVTPIVGAMPWPYPFNLATDEVGRVFTIPLAWLADPANRTIRRRDLPPPFDPVSVIYFNQFDGELLWGVSAQIVVNFLQALQS
jgi:8-oxo-dGTP pyrophosphatase MutT (NUDIX family)